MSYKVTTTVNEFKKGEEMENLLQQMYDDANWYGYATHKGKQYYGYKIGHIANRLGIKLEYNCPA